MSHPSDIPNVMFGLLKTIPGVGYDLKPDINVPEPKDDEVLIKVDAISLCGSDISLWDWNNAAKAIAEIPFTPGHECCGTIIKCGPNTNLKIGDRIAVENHFYCGNCCQCKMNRGDICQNMGQFGHGKKTPYGGCSEYSLLSSKYCYKLATDINAEEAALLEPLGVAYNAVENLGDIENEDVLILGAGPIGLLAASVAKCLKAKRVLIADINDKRLELALEMGADVIIDCKKQDIIETILKETDGNGAGRLIEASGSVQLATKMFQMLRKGGHLVLVGLVKQPFQIENYMRDLLFKSLQIRSIHGRKIYHTWIESEKLVKSGKVPLLKVISHRFKLKDYQEAFKVLLNGEACKIVLTT